MRLSNLKPHQKMVLKFPILLCIIKQWSLMETIRFCSMPTEVLKFRNCLVIRQLQAFHGWRRAEFMYLPICVEAVNSVQNGIRRDLKRTGSWFMTIFMRLPKISLQKKSHPPKSWAFMAAAMEDCLLAWHSHSAPICTMLLFVQCPCWICSATTSFLPVQAGWQSTETPIFPKSGNT